MTMFSQQIKANEIQEREIAWTYGNWIRFCDRFITLVIALESKSTRVEPYKNLQVLECRDRQAIRASSSDGHKARYKA